MHKKVGEITNSLCLSEASSYLTMAKTLNDASHKIVAQKQSQLYMHYNAGEE